MLRTISLLSALTAAAALTDVSAVAATKVAGAVNHAIIWTPEYYGGKVYINAFDYTVTPQKFVHTAINVAARHCNPNSVVVQGASLYVVCNSDFGGKDQVLVYNTTTHAFVRTITGLATDGGNYFTNSSLIGAVFDGHGNLWVSGYNGNDLLRIPAGQLTKTFPRVDRQVVDSPDSPAGITIDTTNGSMWVVGQFAGGIVLNFTDAALNQPGKFLGAMALNPSPSYCISNAAGAGCQNVAGLFNAPEGVALFDGAVWVSNNGGNAPTGTIVRLAPKAGGQLTPSTYGKAIDKPFSCPGGMFAVKGGATQTLWVNDEGAGVPDSDCGATPGDQGDQLGRVMEFVPSDLVSHRIQPTPETFTGYGSLKTSSPGFGGIFVQLN